MSEEIKVGDTLYCAGGSRGSYRYPIVGESAGHLTAQGLDGLILVDKVTLVYQRSDFSFQFVTPAQHRLDVWLKKYRPRIRGAVRQSDDIPLLRQIASLLGIETEDPETMEI